MSATYQNRPIYEQQIRLLPRTVDKPVWVSQQNPQQRQLILKQLEYLKTLGYQRFTQLVIGRAATQYKTKIYHIGQLQSQSFCLIYKFNKNNSPSIQYFANFLQKIFKEVNLTITLGKQNQIYTYYVMVRGNKPFCLKIFQLNYPNQINLFTNITYCVSILKKWIMKNGRDGYYQTKNNSTQMRQPQTNYVQIPKQQKKTTKKLEQKIKNQQTANKQLEQNEKQKKKQKKTKRIANAPKIQQSLDQIKTQAKQKSKTKNRDKRIQPQQQLQQKNIQKVDPKQQKSEHGPKIQQSQKVTIKKPNINSTKLDIRDLIKMVNQMKVQQKNEPTQDVQDNHKNQQALKKDKIKKKKIKQQQKS